MYVEMIGYFNSHWEGVENIAARNCESDVTSSILDNLGVYSENPGESVQIEALAKRKNENNSWKCLGKYHGNFGRLWVK